MQIAMFLTFEIFGSARNHGKKFQKLCQTSFCDIVHCQVSTANPSKRIEKCFNLRNIFSNQENIFRNFSKQEDLSS